MKTNYIKRDIEKTVKHYAGIFPAVAVLGARQTGKTTMLQNIFEKNYKYVSLDDLEQREYAENDPKGFLEDLGSRVIIDEI
nr:AAA family ATPase [Candidatus Goldiibacteriota bacterium]